MRTLWEYKRPFLQKRINTSKTLLAINNLKKWSTVLTNYSRCIRGFKKWWEDENSFIVVN
jgi:hypothetical protein